MKVGAKGQVTIPRGIREQAGFAPGEEVEFELDGDTVCMRRAPSRRGDLLVSRVRGRATVAMTTDQILGLTRRR